MDGEITVQLGSVRRYARFLSLDADEADELLVDALRQLMPSDRRNHASARIQLFKALHKCWIPVDRPGFTPTNRLDYLLAKLCPIDRAALLLCVFEGFSLREAAEITGVSERELEAAIGRAHVLTGFGWSRRVLIFAPDVVMAQQLHDLVEELGFEPVGPFSSPREVIASASSSLPDLVITDAELDGEETGASAVNHIRQALSVPVVLVTSRPGQHSEFCADTGTFLVRKPLSPVALAGCLRQVFAKPIG
ncbi:sigma factor-like helix-turn-helix DNA-binding protein [Glycocaulis sp.]|uniref:sigma factor-like helix-turn-helix DNA-binding protein n=1 Tax=Glycocaulis sp. TaxID=1969725 RepID=UPI003D24B646